MDWYWWLLGAAPWLFTVPMVWAKREELLDRLGWSDWLPLDSTDSEEE